jgi:hypothetical protein
VKQFPQTTTLATPFNNPIAQSIEEYQSFLKTFGYSPIADAAFWEENLIWRIIQVVLK